MRDCHICGGPTAAQPIRYWSPDDGWVIGRLCSYCHEAYADVQPHPDDYAYDDHRSEYVADVDQAIDELYG